MGRVATLEPKYHKQNKKWYIAIPAAMSDTGKRKFVYFDDKKQAQAHSDNLKQTEKDRLLLSRSVDAQLMKDAAECDYIAQEMGFSGLREAFRYWSTDYDSKERAPKFRDLLANWEKDHELNWTPVYRRTRWEPFCGYFLDEHKDTSIALMDQEWWRDWLKAWQKKEFIPKNKRKGVYQKGTYNQVLALIRSMFSQNMALKHHPINPAKGIQRMKREVDGKTRKKCIFSVDDAQLLLNTALEHEPRMVPYFAVLLFAGARPDSEIRRVKWEDIDWDDKHVRLEITKTEGKVDVRYVTLEPVLEAWLAPYRGNKGFIAPQKNLRRLKDNIVKGYHTTAGATQKNKKDWVPLVEWGHDVTRHSYASYYEAAHRYEPGCREKLAYNMGHMSHKTFEDHYKNSRTVRQGKAYWAIFPPNLPENIKFAKFG